MDRMAEGSYRRRVSKLPGVPDARAYRIQHSRGFCKTQPALTRRIQQLEDEFGVSLLARSRSGAELTETGHMVVQEARVLIDRYQRGRSEWCKDW